MPNKLCTNCICKDVCKHNASIERTVHELDVAIRYPANEVGDNYFNDQITRDLKTLKDRALKLTGKHCKHFKEVK